MPKTDRKTRTAATPHGDVEYTVVECDSCGTEVAEEDAVKFTMGHCRGWACPYCAETGPVGFPDAARTKLIKRDGDVLAGILMWPVASVLFLMDRTGDGERGYALASLGAWVWIITTAVALYLLL